MGDYALRFLSESLSLGIGLPLCLTPRVRCEDWEESSIGSNVNISFPWRLVVGDHVWIGDDVGILSLAQVTIESNVCVARRSFLCTGSHDVRREDFKTKVAPILIRTGSWIAIGSLILPGVTIGEGAVVSAGSVVLKDVPANCLVRGNPATVVHEISRGPECAKAYRVSRVCDKSLSPSPDPAAVVEGSPHITKEGR